MDPKILTAVFFSLAAVATGMDMGTVTPQNVTEVELDGGEGISGLSTGFGILDQLLASQRPEPDNQVEIKLETPDKVNFRTRSADITVEGLEEYNSTRKITSDSEITFLDVRGEHSFGINDSIDGRAGGFSSSGVEAALKFPLRIKPVETVNYVNVERIKLSFANSTGEVVSDGGTINLNQSDVSINSFTGNISYDPGDDGYELEGLVNSLNSGDVSIS